MKRIAIFVLCASLTTWLASCGNSNIPSRSSDDMQTPPSSADDSVPLDAASDAAVAKDVTDATDATDATNVTRREIATFGAGCFWCVEAVLEKVDGVEDVVSGYMGGSIANPTYRQVCSGTSGHAEVVQVTFDPRKIAYESLVEWLFKLHDPTTLNSQGADSGTQYRSAIFWHSEAQRATAEATKKRLDSADAFDDPIVTEITKASEFYAAEADHQDFYQNNKSSFYCQFNITPKLRKLGLDE